MKSIGRVSLMQMLVRLLIDIGYSVYSYIRLKYRVIWYIGV
jgi:hypothetical protein